MVECIKKGKDIILKNAENFHIEQILECGQCFHFEKLGEKEYVIAAKDHLLHIKQDEDKVIFYKTSEEVFYNIWQSYFDLDNDYGAIIKQIGSREKLYLKARNEKETSLIQMMGDKSGIRILNQDFFETLISFIMSQNKQIPHIKQIVSNLSERYGNYLGEVGGKKYYTFPSAKILSEVSEAELRECKMGFRAPYVLDACGKVLSGTVSEERMRKADIIEAKEELLQIKGVGEKIANCVLLFGLGKTSAFPVDVWIKRIMENLYFEKETKNEEIIAAASELFGEYGGYAQQYLFYYGREHQIGKIRKS